ncbi:MAG: phosphonate ABC transporter, permease protein PhnE, partial [Brevibacterium aurantiacum]
MSMLTEAPPDVREVPVRPRPAGSSLAAALVMIALVVGGVWSVGALGIDAATIVDSFDNAVNFFARMFPLDFPPVAETLSLVFETLAIVFL